MDISLPWKKGMNLMALLTKKLLRCISLISVQLIEAGTLFLNRITDKSNAQALLVVL